jgi:hypothetical protein
MAVSKYVLLTALLLIVQTMLAAHWSGSRRDSSIGPLSLQGMFYHSDHSYLIPTVG